MGVRVKVIDEEHDSDLEEALNAFLVDIATTDLIDIKYQISHFSDGGQIYSYSAMVIYKDSAG